MACKGTNWGSSRLLARSELARSMYPAALASSAVLVLLYGSGSVTFLSYIITMPLQPTCFDEKKAVVAFAARALSGPLVLMPQSGGWQVASVCCSSPGTCIVAPSLSEHVWF